MTDRHENPLNRRRKFAPGTITKRLTIFVSEHEKYALEARARKADTSIPDLLVSSALTPKGRFPMRLAQALGFKMLEAKNAEADAELLLRKLTKAGIIPAEFTGEAERVSARLRASRHELDAAIEEVIP